MKLHRFFPVSIRGNVYTPGDMIVLTDQAIVHQIIRVFRMKKGDSFIICNNEFVDYFVTLESTSRDSLSCSVAQVKTVPHVSRDVAICIAITKGPRFDEALLHLAEVGVSKVIPIITERTQKKDLNNSRAEKILREGAEQSGLGKVPEVISPIPLREAVKIMKEEQRELWWCDTQEDTKEKIRASSEKLAVFVGPEGGFTESETELAHSVGVKPISLGKTVLRAETAALVAAYLATSEIF